MGHDCLYREVAREVKSKHDVTRHVSQLCGIPSPHHMWLMLLTPSFFCLSFLSCFYNRTKGLACLLVGVTCVCVVSYFAVRLYYNTRPNIEAHFEQRTNNVGDPN